MEDKTPNKNADDKMNQRSSIGPEEEIPDVVFDVEEDGRFDGTAQPGGGGEWSKAVGDSRR